MNEGRLFASQGGGAVAAMLGGTGERRAAPSWAQAASRLRPLQSRAGGTAARFSCLLVCLRWL